MSQKETTDHIGRPDVRASADVNVSQYAELARQAFEQKRMQDCLDLTRAILLIDPGNTDAQAMRSSIQLEMHRDLDNARSFIKQAKETPKEQPEPRTIPPSLAREELPFFAGHAPPQSAVSVVSISDRMRAIRPLGSRWLVVASTFAAVCVVVAGLIMLRTPSNSAEASQLAVSAADKPTPPPPVTKGPAEKAKVPLPAPAIPAPAPPRVPAVMPALALKPSVPAPAAAAPDRLPAAANGTLAISSPATVDIYENDAYLGSAPVSLQLSAGTHIIEYRHGSLRKSVTYAINSNDTAKATITFEVSVQINSKPWAEVFVDGANRRDLGQTPLSSVRVPIGGVLSFENPQYTPKKYRITGNETGIQVVFP